MNKITATLEAIHSKADVYGNRYWAMRYTDHATGKVVKATISGNDSNIRGILFNWSGTNDWDRSVMFNITELKIRGFNALTKNWPYAGCSCAELAEYIKNKLKD